MNVPAAQLVHELAPDEPLYEPLGQVVHDAAPPLE